MTANIDWQEDKEQGKDPEIRKKGQKVTQQFFLVCLRGMR